MNRKLLTKNPHGWVLVHTIASGKSNFSGSLDSFAFYDLRVRRYSSRKKKEEIYLLQRKIHNVVCKSFRKS